MIKPKVAFLEGRLLSSQSEQLKKYSKNFDWLEKIRHFKKPHCVDHVNRLYINFSFSDCSWIRVPVPYSESSM